MTGLPEPQEPLSAPRPPAPGWPAASPSASPLPASPPPPAPLPEQPPGGMPAAAAPAGHGAPAHAPGMHGPGAHGPAAPGSAAYTSAAYTSGGYTPVAHAAEAHPSGTPGTYASAGASATSGWPASTAAAAGSAAAAGAAVHTAAMHTSAHTSAGPGPMPGAPPEAGQAAAGGADRQNQPNRSGGTGRAGRSSRRSRQHRLSWSERWYLREVLVAWIAARVVVGAALALTRFISQTVSDEGGSLPTTDLLGWDAGWYFNIAENGYEGAGDESRRFFPLLPMLVRLLTVLPGLGGQAGSVQLVVVNLAAIGFALAVVGVARLEGFGDEAIRRLIWLTALAPPAFVLVMGYSEALAGLLAAIAFLGARTRRWELAAVAALLSGLCRPLGLLLAVPIAVEAARGLPLPLARRLGPPPGTQPDAQPGQPADQAAARSPAGAATRAAGRAPAAAAGQIPSSELLRRLAAVVAAPVGAGIYLLWSAIQFGDGLAPLTMQRDAERHGSTSNPIAVMVDAARGAFDGEVGTAMHVPWLLLAFAGLVVMARRLPVSYFLWCLLVLAVVLTGSNLDSSERYLFGAFPFLLVAALVTSHREVWMLVLTVSTALLTVYATLAFTLSYVP